MTKRYGGIFFLNRYTRKTNYRKDEKTTNINLQNRFSVNEETFTQMLSKEKKKNIQKNVIVFNLHLRT